MLSSTISWFRCRFGAIDVRRLFDVAQVRLAPFIERRWNADQHGVHVAQSREIGGGVEALALDVLADFVGRDVLDVGLAGVQFVDFAGIGIESGDALADIRKAQRQRQSHVPAADNADLDVFPCKELRLAFRSHPASKTSVVSTCLPLSEVQA